MLRRTSLSSLIVACLLLSPLATLGQESSPSSTAPETVRLMVELHDAGVSSASLMRLYPGITTIRRLSHRAPRDYDADGTTRTARDLRRWRVIETDAASASTLLAELQADPAVVSAAYAMLYHAAVLPNDPDLIEQYALYSPIQPLADINAPAAWDVTTGSANTVIAIIDGGLDATHEDLAAKIWSNSGEVAGNSVDDDGNGYIDDVHGWDFVRNQPSGLTIHHATHVAGIAAAAANNGIGITGVNWQARLMDVRVLGSGGAGSEDDIVAGINYAVSSGADIINLSLVGRHSAALSAAVENAYAAGVVVVAAAGNAGSNTGAYPVYPACADVNGVDMVIGVAATDSNGEPWSGSNYGTCINIAAPGKSIYSTKAGDSYGTMTGTSMASPLVAGVAGLYLAQHPNASPAAVIAAISSGDSFTGEDAVEWNADYKGKLNAASVVGAAVNDNPSSTPAPTNAPPASSSESGSSGGDSGGGGGGGDGGGGGGGSTSEEPAPAPSTRPAGQVKGTQTKISAVDRRAKDFITNPTVPVVVARLFKQAFGRAIIPAESTYWKARARSDKATVTKLLGAMQWQKLRGKSVGR